MNLEVTTVGAARDIRDDFGTLDFNGFLTGGTWSLAGNIENGPSGAAAAAYPDGVLEVIERSAATGEGVIQRVYADALELTVFERFVQTDGGLVAGPWRRRPLNSDIEAQFETGTWPCNLTAYVFAGEPSSFDVLYAHYMRNGDLVMIDFLITDIEKGAATGFVLIEGLPFPPAQYGLSYPVRTSAVNNVEAPFVRMADQSGPSLQLFRSSSSFVNARYTDFDAQFGLIAGSFSYRRAAV